MNVQALFGITAGVLELITAGFYIRSILKENTRPDRVTWWIIAVVNGMLTISYFESGARETIWLPLAYTLCFIIYGLLSLRYGEGSVTLSVIDRFCLIGALLSAFIWWLVRSPVPALFMNIATELTGLMPTIEKSYHRPWTEGRLPWTLATIASLFNVLAVREWTLIIGLYPVYTLVSNALIMFFVLRKRTV